MNGNNHRVNRRRFLKSVGATGFGCVLARSVSADPNAVAKDRQPELPQLPRRKFGKTGEDVSALSLGAIQLVDNQVILVSSLKWGMTYWDTAYGYTGGNSEQCIGKFLEKNPEVRKKLFVATKASGAYNVEDVEDRLQTSLKRMNTDYIDVFYGVHVLNDISQLTDDLKSWAESAKKRGLIKYFGFSTHKNMERSLYEASKMGWIDAILTTYNFRLTKDAEMKKAIDACHKAGVALTAMKTQKSVTVDTDEDKKLMAHFSEKGFTEGQAKIKAVLEDERISAVTVGMNSVSLITENVAAVLDETKLSQQDKLALEQYAQATCSGYCAGCAEICDEAVPQAPYVSDVMRSLMYHNNYGDNHLARQSFAEIPAETRANLLKVDYSAAEARCPQKMPIARLMREAVAKLA